MHKRAISFFVFLAVLFAGAFLFASADEPSLVVPLKNGKFLDPSAAAGTGNSGKSSKETTIIGRSEHNDLSLPLRWMPASQPLATKVVLEIPNRELPSRGPKHDASFKDPVVQNSPFSTDISVAPNIPSTGQNFDGVTNVNGVLPPDTNGDVGPNHYVQTVNLSYAVFNKSGVKLLGPLNTNSIWSGFGGPCQTSNNGDPIVLYDQAADRWLISQFALPVPYYQCIAISQSGDPTGAYFRYAFQMSSNLMNDYPHFGIWPDGYYMSYHNFLNGASYNGWGNAAFERAKMLLGQPAQVVIKNFADTSRGGQLPSDLDGSTPPPAGAPNYTVQYFGSGLEIYEFKVNWVTPASSTFTLVKTLPVAGFTEECIGTRSCVPQPNTTVRLDGIGDRLMYRLAYRNRGGVQSLLANHTVNAGSGKAGVRWYEVRNPGASATLFQQGTYSPDADYRWMGSLAMDSAGDIALGYSVGNTGLFASIRYTGRLATDPLGTLPQGEGSIIAGTGSQTHSASRWGDYSSMSLDPSDDCTFWYTTEYIQTTGSAPWRTRIASFKFPNCGGGGGCTTPSGFNNNTAADVNACADTGVQVTWNNPTAWGDTTGTRTHDVLRDGTVIASGLSEATTSYTDTTGTNGQTYSYTVRHNNGCGSSATTAGASASDFVGSTPVTETANQSGTLTAKNNTVTAALAPATTITGATASSATATWTLGGNTTLTACSAVRLRAPGGVETTLKAAGAANTGTANVLSFYQTNGPGTYTFVLQELASCGQRNRNAALTAGKLTVQKPGTCP